MLTDDDLKRTLAVLLRGLPSATITNIMFKAVDKTCNGYERSNTDVYEEMICIATKYREENN